MREQEWVEFEGVTLLAQTENAGLFQFEDGDEVWLPWSQVSEGSPGNNGEVGTLGLTAWICEKKGIEY